MKRRMSRTALWLALPLVALPSAEAQIRHFTNSTALRAFSLPNHPFGSLNSQRVTHGDVDGDGDLDVFLATDRGVRLILNGAGPADNEAYGRFADVTGARLIGAPSASAFDADLADADGDGDLDLFASYNIGGQNVQLFLNVGTNSGTFANATAANMPFLTPAVLPSSLAPGDVDGDGDIDLIVGGIPYFNSTFTCLVNGQTRALINNGAGVFTDGTLGRMPTDNDNTTDVILGDVDNDGDLDLFLANPHQAVGCPAGGVGGQNKLYRNNGAGVFTDVTVGTVQATVQDRTVRAEFGDLNGDGRLDVIVARQGLTNGYFSNSASGAPSYLFLFPLSPGNQNSTDVAVGDVDDDADLDIVFGNSGQTEIWINGGGGGTWIHSTSTRMPVDSGLFTGGLDLFDADRDGDADLVLGDVFAGGGVPGFRLYANLHRQIDSGPTIGIGQTYQIDVYHQPGYGTGQALLALYFSGLPQVPRVPFAPYGDIGINLNGAGTVNVGPFAPGVQPFTLAIPNDPGLIGTTFYWQGVMVPPAPAGPKLTNVLRMNIL